MYWADAASSFGIGPLNPVSLQYTTPELLIGMIREVQSAEVVAAAKALQAREREEQASSLTGEHIMSSICRLGSFAGVNLAADPIALISSLPGGIGVQRAAVTLEHIFRSHLNC